MLVLGGLAVVLVGFVAAAVVAVVLLVRRNVGRAHELRARWAALAAAHGLVLDPGSALHDPVLSGTFNGGRPVTLTLSRYQMGAGGLSYDYTVARAPVALAGEILVAERNRVHHVAAVGGVKVPVDVPGLAATHTVRGYPPELARALLAAPEVMAGLGRNQVTHLRLAGGQLQVQRPGHLVDGGACLGLMQLTADLALRWG